MFGDDAYYALPFSTGWLIVWDTLRCAAIIGGLLVIVFACGMIARTNLLGRIALTVALICFLTAAIGTEIEHLGDAATFRLFLNVIGTTVAGVGLWAARREP